MAKPMDFKSLTAKMKDNCDSKLGLLTKEHVQSVIPTGSLVLDKLSGIGGIPKGRVTQIASEPSGGKSTAALTICRETQLCGGKVLYLDFEQAMSPHYAEKIGCDLSEEAGTMALYQPVSIEVAWKLILAYAEAGVDLIVFDSVAAMWPEVKEDDEEKMSSAIGVQARALGFLFPKLVQLIRQYNIAALFINQVRNKITTGFAGRFQTQPAYSKELPGGWTPKFYTSLLYYMEIRKAEKSTGTNSMTGDTEDIYDCNKVKITTWKNKLSSPFRSGEIYIQFGGRGIDDLRSVVEVGKNLSIIDYGRTGNWTLTAGKKEYKGRGEVELKNLFVANPAVYEEIRERIIAHDFISVEAPTDEMKKIQSEDDSE